MLLFSILAFSCHDEETATKPVENEKVHFVSATPVGEIPLPLLKLLASGLGYNELNDILKYGVKSFKLVYQTTYNGTAINASGLVLLPLNMTGAAPIISVQHGTNFLKEDAPTVAGKFTGVELFTSAGYIALMPDYIGYGESSDLFHPYYDKTHSALAVIDMIKAVKEFLVQQKIAFNEKLFLAGYSEGGYVTLATAEAIETNLDPELQITAVASGAGGNDLVEMLKGVTTDDYYSYPSYLAFVLMSYNTTYGWHKPLNYFFAQQYADSLTKYMNGAYGGSTINAKLTTSVSELLSTEFLASLKTTVGEPQLKEAISNNTLGGWRTETPIRLYHGTQDEIIPYHNSELTLEKYKSAGSVNVSLTPIQNGTHGSSFVPMLRDIIPWFEEMR